MSMSAPNSWLFASDNSRYSTRARLLFMALSFAIGILTFLLYLALWYLCGRRRQQRRRRRQQAAEAAAALFADGEGGDRGMSPEAIAALPTVAHDAESGPLDCPVCLGQVEAGETVRRLPKCAHSFHADCVDAWLRAHSTCPMCRAAVVVGPAAAAAAKRAETAAAAATAVVSAPPSAPLAAAELPPV